MHKRITTSCVLLYIFFLLMTAQLSTAGGVTIHTGDTLFVNYGTTPVINGNISSTEWSDAISVVLVDPYGSPGDVTVYIKHDASNLYVAFKNTNGNNWVWWMLIDTQNNGGSTPQSDDYKLVGPGWMVEYVGNGSDWVETTPTGWTVAGDEYNSESSISYSKLGITAGTAKTLGIVFCHGGAMPWENVWPPGFDAWSEEVIPNAWGDVVSDDDWGQGIVAEENNLSAKPEVFFKSYPNPYSQSLAITFYLGNTERTVLEVFDVEGRLVRTLVNKQLSVGEHTLSWDRRDREGKIVSKGTYFCQLKIGKLIHTQNIVVID